MKKEAEASFAKMIEKIHQSADKRNKDTLQIKTDIVASVRIADAIVSYAEDKHVDLIVTGTRSRIKLKVRYLVDIITPAHCPVDSKVDKGIPISATLPTNLI